MELPSNMIKSGPVWMYKRYAGALLARMSHSQAKQRAEELGLRYIDHGPGVAPGLR